MVRSLAEIHAEQKALAEEEKKAVKAHKKEAVATVKKLILEFNLTKGDIQGNRISKVYQERTQEIVVPSSAFKFDTV